MIHRQRVMLRLLECAGGSVSRLRLIKLAFLLAHESPLKGGRAFYQFVPYRYGPYSFTLTHELANLARDGVVDQDGSYRWGATCITNVYSKQLPIELENDVDWTVKRYADTELTRLIDYVYERYPWYTVNCDNEFRRACKRPVADPAIYTAGYEGFQVDGFFNLIFECGMQGIVDVRSNPVSRKYGFHKNTLHAICEKFGIDYIHVPTLGIPSRLRTQSRVQEESGMLLAKYRERISRSHDTELDYLSNILQQKPCTLMCIEANPANCHRSILAGVLSKGIDLQIVQLGWPR